MESSTSGGCTALDVYNTAINVIGSIGDYTVLYKAINAYFNVHDSLDDLIVRRNEFNLRTEKSRVRIKAEIQKSFLCFHNQEHKDLIENLFTDKVPEIDKKIALFWHLSVSNRLFREISSNVFAKTYYSGRVAISSDDVRAYLKELINQNKALGMKWSEKTISTIATKYLSFMSKLGFLSPGRTKFFKLIKPSPELQVIFLYFAKLGSPHVNNILINEFLDISFIPREDLQAILKRLSLKGFFNMNFNGVALNIELTHSYKEICDVLYN